MLPNFLIGQAMAGAHIGGQSGEQCDNITAKESAENDINFSSLFIHVSNCVVF